MNLGTIRRAALAALILAVVASCGCSGDGLTAPRGLRISDVGRRVAVHEFGDGVVEPLYEPGEVLLRVFNFRAYPRSMSIDIFRPADGFGLARTLWWMT